jgi:multidrug efflux system membrane fusion protein
LNLNLLNEENVMSNSTIRTFVLGSIASLVLSACGTPEAATPGAMAAPEINVATVVQEKITEWDEFTGRLQAPETVTLVPRVSGYIEQVFFTEGALVQQGDLLFQIDARPFAAEVARLKAELTSAETAQKLADNDYRRAAALKQQKAISEEVLDTRQSRKQQSAATVASVKAALERAELDLSYTQVKAPISGRVSYAQITAGNFVQAGSSQLTTLVSTNKMYAYFDADEQTYLKYVQLASAGNRAQQRTAHNTVYMALAGDQDFAYVGSIDFIDNSINAQTGTIRARATFENTDNKLIPGLFARLKLVGSNAYEGILIDDKAIGTDLANKFVLVVNDQNQLEYRAVTLGEKVNGLRIISKGLAASDRIVVNGLQRVRPTMTIQPKLVEMASSQQLTSLKAQQQQLERDSKLELTASADVAANHG